MAKLVVLYKQPADPAAFDRHYFDTHIPLAKKISGLQRYEVSRGPVSGPTGPSPYHLIATLEFESLDTLQQGMASVEGKAAAQDVANFGQAGVEMLIFEGRDV